MSPSQCFALVIFHLVVHGSYARIERSVPNFVLILTDDQDDVYHTMSGETMPAATTLLRDAGIAFQNFFVHTSVCCPSRTTLLRGQYAHNHNLTYPLPPHGGYEKFRLNNLDEAYLPGWLVDAGYQTRYIGKFLVTYGESNWKAVPRSWDHFEGLLWPYSFNYNNATFGVNGKDVMSYPGEYSTDVVARKACEQIQAANADGRPFFLQIAPIAPHTALAFDSNHTLQESDPEPAPRHLHLFLNHTVPDLGNLNESDTSDKPAWLRRLPALTQEDLDKINMRYVRRLQSLRAVDELVARVVGELESLELLDDTYVIYTSDNGYHLGAHRLTAGKMTAYEEDLKVPFIIRGPGIPRGQVAHTMAGMVDIAPTILSLAHIALPDSLDGLPLFTDQKNSQGEREEEEDRPLDINPQLSQRDTFLAEYWAKMVDEIYSRQEVYRVEQFAYRSVRAADLGSGRGLQETCTYQYKYTLLGTDERELYDLMLDPAELRNVAGKPSYARVIDRLDAVLSVLSNCRGQVCSNPWLALHPDGIVANLTAAMHSRHDELYARLHKYAFQHPTNFYDFNNELSFYKVAPSVPTPGADPYHTSEDKECWNGEGACSVEDVVV